MARHPERQRYKAQGLTTRGTGRKRKNFGGAQKVCRECGITLVVGDNILPIMFNHREYICRQCNVTKNQLYYRDNRFFRMIYNKTRQGITEKSRCSTEGCDAPWFILQPHHLPDGTEQIICPNHHALWHWFNGHVVRQKRFTSKEYRRWKDVSSIDGSL